MIVDVHLQSSLQILLDFECHADNNFRHRSFLLVDNEMSPHMSNATENLMYILPKMTFRHIFYICSSFWLCSIVRLEWKATEQYSAMLLMNNTYISMGSLVLTPAYFNLVIIDSLEYAFMHISWQFADHVKSSATVIPRILLTFICSM